MSSNQPSQAYKFSEVHAWHWDQFAEGAGLAKALTKRRILELAKSWPSSARKLQSDPEQGFAGNAVVGRIIELVEQRCALTKLRLTDATANSEAADEPY